MTEKTFRLAGVRAQELAFLGWRARREARAEEKQRAKGEESSSHCLAVKVPSTVFFSSQGSQLYKAEKLKGANEYAAITTE